MKRRVGLDTHEVRRLLYAPRNHVMEPLVGPLEDGSVDAVLAAERDVLVVVFDHPSQSPEKSSLIGRSLRATSLAQALTITIKPATTRVARLPTRRAGLRMAFSYGSTIFMTSQALVEQRTRLKKTEVVPFSRASA